MGSADSPGKIAFNLIIAGLMGISCFMIKHMIDEQDEMKKIVYQLRQDVAVMNATFESRHKKAASE